AAGRSPAGVLRAVPRRGARGPRGDGRHRKPSRDPAGRDGTRTGADGSPRVRGRASRSGTATYGGPGPTTGHHRAVISSRCSARMNQSTNHTSGGDAGRSVSCTHFPLVYSTPNSPERVPGIGKRPSKNGQNHSICVCGRKGNGRKANPEKDYGYGYSPQD